MLSGLASTNLNIVSHPFSDIFLIEDVSKTDATAPHRDRWHFAQVFGLLGKIVESGFLHAVGN